MITNTDQVMFVLYLPPELMAALQDYALERKEDVHKLAEKILDAAVNPQPLTEGL